MNHLRSEGASTIGKTGQQIYFIFVTHKNNSPKSIYIQGFWGDMLTTIRFML